MLQESDKEVKQYIITIKMWVYVLGFLEILLKMWLGCILKTNE